MADQTSSRFDPFLTPIDRNGIARIRGSIQDAEVAIAQIKSVGAKMITSEFAQAMDREIRRLQSFIETQREALVEAGNGSRFNARFNEASSSTANAFQAVFPSSIPFAYSAGNPRSNQQSPFDPGYATGTENMGTTLSPY